MIVLTIFIFESQLIQMPGTRDIVIYRSGPRAFSIVQKPRGWAHISVQKPRGGRGEIVTGQIDTCITNGVSMARIFWFSLKKLPFSRPNRIHIGFLVQIRDQRFKTDPRAKCQPKGQTIRELEFGPRMIPRTTL